VPNLIRNSQQPYQLRRHMAKITTNHRTQNLVHSIVSSDGVLEDMSLASRILENNFCSPWPCGSWPWPSPRGSYPWLHHWSSEVKITDSCCICLYIKLANISPLSRGVCDPKMVEC